MIHLSSFEAVHYRGIDGLSLPKLSHANLVTGVNGIGKTSLVEAIWLFMGRYKNGLLKDRNILRSYHPVTNPVSELSDCSIDLRGIEDGEEYQWKASFDPVEQVVRESSSSIQRVGSRIVQGGSRPESDNRDCIIEGTRWQLETPDEYLQRYSVMVRKGHKQELTSAINLILPKIEDVEILTDETGKSYLSASTSTNDQLPLQALGGGVVRLFRLYLSFFTARNGMVLIDEIENGIHYSVMRNLWDRVRVWMREWNVQFVATTHSAECIDAAMEAFADELNDLSIHNLFANESGNIKVATFTGEALEGARNLNLEVR